MKKTLLFVLIAICTFNTARSQTYLKANALYWGVLMPNVSGEVRISDKFTINCDVVGSLWNSFAGYKLKFIQVIPEIRYFYKGSFKGLYTGFYASHHRFNMTKWNYKNENKIQKGWGQSLGITIGYQHHLSDKWMMDMYLGGGWQHSRYRGYYKDTNEKYESLNSSGEWIPYKIGVSFAYKILKRRNKSPYSQE